MTYEKKTDNPNLGRPKKQIDQDQFEEMCRIHCTASEICGVLKVSDKTLYNWCNETYDDNFSVVYKSFKDEGKMSLRRYQWRMAEKNPTMAIWLGKQELGQKDKHEEEVNVGEKLDNLTNALLGKAMNNDENNEE